jgi:hypothetical protein
MSTEADNHMVWDRHRAGHYEVWYATFNHRRSNTGYWIRYTLESPQPGRGERYAQLWFAFFDATEPARNFAINRKFPIGALQAGRNPFEVRIGDSLLRHDGLRGSLSGEGHTASWNLTHKPCLFTHRHLPEPLYRSSLPDTLVLSPNLMLLLHGEVTVDGQTYAFDGEPGCQTHLWGRKHAHAWAWSHCNAFRDDPTACLETLTVRLRRLGLVTPRITFISLYIGTEVYHLRSLGGLCRTRGRWETGLYRLSGVGRRIRVEAELRCHPEDLVRATYVDPDGEASFCQNTEVADCSLTVWTRRGWGTPFKRPLRLFSRGTAHFEYAGRTPDGHVGRHHITVP